MLFCLDVFSNVIFVGSVECIQSNGSVFMDLSGTTGSPSLTEHTRRMSDASILSTVSGMGDTVPLATINACMYTTASYFFDKYYLQFHSQVCSDTYSSLVQPIL